MSILLTNFFGEFSLFLCTLPNTIKFKDFSFIFRAPAENFVHIRRSRFTYSFTKLLRDTAMLNKIWAAMILISILTAALRGCIGELGTALIEASQEAITLGLTIVGVISLWTGLTKVAERSGLMDFLEARLHPILHWLFPDIPPGHAAFRHIAANFTANLIGLGWAATPPGLKAMESLQELNPHPEKASRTMCAFMIINMSSLQLIPINMLAYRLRYGSANPAEIVGPALLATIVSTLTAVIYVKITNRTRPI